MALGLGGLRARRLPQRVRPDDVGSSLVALLRGAEALGRRAPRGGAGDRDGAGPLDGHRRATGGVSAPG